MARYRVFICRHKYFNGKAMANYKYPIVNTTSKLVASLAPLKGSLILASLSYYLNLNFFHSLSYFVRVIVRVIGCFLLNRFLFIDYEYRFAEYEYEYDSTLLNNLIVLDTNHWRSHCSYHRHAGGLFLRITILLSGTP